LSDRNLSNQLDQIRQFSLFCDRRVPSQPLAKVV